MKPPRSTRNQPTQEEATVPARNRNARTHARTHASVVAGNLTAAPDGNAAVPQPLPSALLGTGPRSSGPGGPRLIVPLQEAIRSPSPPPPPAHLLPPPFLPSAGPLFSASWAVSGTPHRLHRHCAEVLRPPTCFGLWGRRSALRTRSHWSAHVPPSVCPSAHATTRIFCVEV